jgi:hypothetical protein
VERLTRDGLSVEGLAGARPEERWMASVVGLEGIERRGGARGRDNDAGEGPEASSDEECSGGGSIQQCSTFCLCCYDLRGKERGER